MNNTYNANLYLTPSDLNYIEGTLDVLTEQTQSIVFNLTNSPLRNIRVGDNLNNKTLYLSFPRNSYENITNTTRKEIITFDENTRIAYMYYSSRRYIYIKYKGETYYIYSKRNSLNNPDTNYVRIKLPHDIGTVATIDSTDEFYQYIKIYENENIIPDYVSNRYNDNDVPTMQKIDNIEQGIKNIGDYYHKPIGWQSAREWLGTPKLDEESSFKGVNIQNISYQDLNRWYNNLSLINFNDIDKMTIWNSSVSEIDWNNQNDTEWEDY